MKQFITQLLLLLILLVSACKREPLQWNTRWSLPLASGTAGVKQLIPDSLLSIRNGGEVWLAWKGRAGASDLNDVFVIPDTSIRKSFNSPLFSFLAQPGTSIFGSSEDLRFNTSATLSKIKLKSGKLRYKIYNKINGRIFFTYTLPRAFKNETNLSITEPIPGGTPASPGFLSGTLDLSGYSIQMTGALQDRFNSIASLYNVRLDPAGTAVMINPTDSVNVEFTFEKLVPDYAKGYFGQSVIQTQGTVPIDLFSQISCEQFFLDDVKMDITLNNGLGADLSCVIEKISMVSSQSGNEIPLQHAMVGNTIQLSRAMEVPYTIQTKKYSLNSSNSNLTQLLSSLPREFRYSIKAMLNPMGNVSSTNDFLVMPRILDADVAIAVPMRLGIKNLMYHTGSSSTTCTADKAVNFRLSVSDQESSRIKTAHMRLRFNNWFPLSMRFEPCFFDENNKELNLTFLSSQPNGGRFVMRAASPASDGRVVSPVESLVDWEVTGADLSQLLKARKMAYRIYLNSVDNNAQYYLWYENYKIDFSVYSRFDYVQEAR